jgi:DNA repair protein RecN (Recombination protein N)
MISQLTIKNFGLIEQLSVEFCDTLNILTGETGAGKSILIDALRFGLGERLDPSQIRRKELPCTVEIVFELSKKVLLECTALSEYLSENEPSCIIHRSYLPDGRNKIKINGFSVTVSELKELGNHLVDFHGPHDHQMLLSNNAHLGILDRLCDSQDLQETYAAHYENYQLLQEDLEKLEALSLSQERDIDLYNHQIKELEQVPLDTAHYEVCLEKQTRYNNAARLYESASQILNLLENEEAGVTRAISQAFTPLKALNKIDESTSAMSEKLDAAQENIEEFLSQLHRYIDELSFQPQEADQINRLCDLYEDITRKYGPTLEDAKKFYELTKEKYSLLINLGAHDAQLREKIAASRQELIQIAQKITQKRKHTALSLKKTIEKELIELGMPHVRFECRIEKTELHRYGQDAVTFYISPNAGEDLKPLANIVSSGEAARLMLALKKALTKVDPIPVLIFDEIDAQIGGRLGTITGKKLRELAGRRQVILITHLPQIASFAESHFKISKKVENNRTLNILERLNSETRVKEIAKMMSGEKESAIALTHAREMLTEAGT